MPARTLQALDGLSYQPGQVEVERAAARISAVADADADSDVCILNRNSSGRVPKEAMPAFHECR